MDRAQAYVNIRSRLMELGRALDDEQAGLVVAACPKWTVKDTFAHLVGNNSDGIAGRMDGVTEDWWTQRQVDERAERNLTEILDEWDEIGPIFESALRTAEEVRPELILDAWTHEQDVRGTVGQPGGADDTVVNPLSGWVVGKLLSGITEQQLPPIEIMVGERTRTSGEYPTVRLSIPAFEYVRAAFGRRSRAQLRAWPWIGTDDPDPYIDAMLIFGITDIDIVDAR